MHASLNGRPSFLAGSILVCIISSGALDQTVRAADPPLKLPSAAPRQVDFLKDIQPILSNTCYECHGPEKQKGGLRLDKKESALKGGDSGPLLAAGKSAESLLLQAVLGSKEDLARMPKKRDPLSAEQLGLLLAWIDQGANWPESSLT